MRILSGVASLVALVSSVAFAAPAPHEAMNGVHHVQIRTRNGAAVSEVWGFDAQGKGKYLGPSYSGNNDGYQNIAKQDETGHGMTPLGVWIASKLLVFKGMAKSMSLTSLHEALTGPAAASLKNLPAAALALARPTNRVGIFSHNGGEPDALFELGLNGASTLANNQAFTASVAAAKLQHIPFATLAAGSKSEGCAVCKDPVRQAMDDHFEADPNKGPRLIHHVEVDENDNIIAATENP